MTPTKIKNSSVSKTDQSELIGALRSYSSIEPNPTKHGYVEFAQATDAPSLEALYEAFGSWRGVCSAAAFRTPRGAPPQGNREAALNSLRRSRRDLGPAFTQREYDAWAQKHGEVSLTSILRMFGVWSNALELAGVAITRVRRIEPGAQIERMIREVCEENGGSLSVRAWNKVRPKGYPSAGRIAKQYGHSWPRALEAAQVVSAYPSPNRIS